jgi:GAF domain-containing protein
MSPRKGSADADDRAAGAAALALLRAVAQRVDVAARLESPAGEAILRSVVDAAVVLIRAEAASIALYDAQRDRLVFRVAAGDQGQGVVGLEIRPGDGVAGYVFSSGAPIAIGETTVDARFQREAAAQTGYVPRSLVAVPLTDDAGTIGVLEILDRRDGSPFDLADIEAATVFARQATVAIRATSLERETVGLVRAALLALAARNRDGDGSALDAAALDALVAGTVAELDDGRAEDVGEGRSAWRLADAVARAGTAAPDQVALVLDILEALAKRAGRATSRYRGARR